MIVGVPLEEFMGWKDDETEVELNGKTQARKHHSRRPASSPSRSISACPVVWARPAWSPTPGNTYRVEMTLEQGEAVPDHKLIRRSIPELAVPGRGRHGPAGAQPRRAGMGALGRRLTARGRASRFIAMRIRNIVRGKTRTRGASRTTRAY